jgi:hypothetical protein
MVDSVAIDSPYFYQYCKELAATNQLRLQMRKIDIAAIEAARRG